MAEKWFPEGIPALAQWWGMCGQTVVSAMLVVAQLLVGSPKPER
jgi:hypothetical protein